MRGALSERTSGPRWAQPENDQMPVAIITPALKVRKGESILSVTALSRRNGAINRRGW